MSARGQLDLFAGPASPAPERRLTKKEIADQKRAAKTAEQIALDACKMRLIGLYISEYSTARRSEPLISGVEYNAVGRLLKLVDNDETKARRAIVNAFADRFWSAKATMLIIAQDPGKFVDRDGGGVKPVGRYMQPVSTAPERIELIDE